MTDEFDRLVQESANENLARLEPKTNIREHPRLEQPMLVLATWTLCIIVSASILFNPLAQAPEIGDKSNIALLSAAMYQLAYRIEVYRNTNNDLPDFLEPEWTSDLDIEYQKSDGHYTLIGRSGDLDLTFRDGDDPERLMHMEIP
jgi:hypothetical protein